MYAWRPPRTLSATAAVAIVALMAGVLVFGLGVRRTIEATVPLVSVSFDTPPPPPPKPPPPRQHKSGANEKPSAANTRNKATAVVAPPVVQPIKPPPPVPTAPKPNIGAATQTGAANLAGPGEGAGGIGNGTGGGGNGDEGEGDGDVAVDPEPIVDHLRTHDLPLQLLPPGEPVTIEVQTRIEADGHITGCRVTRPSRYPSFDQVICPLIERQYRYRPARDENGRPVGMTMVKSETFEYMAR